MSEADQTNDVPQTPVEIVEWMESRKKLDGAFNYFAGGYGPAGKIQLQLPSPKRSETWVFRDGKPVSRKSESCLNDPALEELRQRVLQTLEAPIGVRVFAGPMLMEYSAALILRNYSVSDAELSMLHAAGGKWINTMILHVLECQTEKETLEKGQKSAEVADELSLASAPAPPGAFHPGLRIPAPVPARRRSFGSFPALLNFLRRR